MSFFTFAFILIILVVVFFRGYLKKLFKPVEKIVGSILRTSARRAKAMEKEQLKELAKNPEEIASIRSEQRKLAKRQAAANATPHKNEEHSRLIEKAFTKGDFEEGFRLIDLSLQKEKEAKIKEAKAKAEYEAKAREEETARDRDEFQVRVKKTAKGAITLPKVIKRAKTATIFGYIEIIFSKLKRAIITIFNGILIILLLGGLLYVIFIFK